METNQQSKEFMPHAISKLDQVVHTKEQTNKTKQNQDIIIEGCYCYVKIYHWFYTLQLDYNRPSPQRILATEMSREPGQPMPSSVSVNVSCYLTKLFPRSCGFCPQEAPLTTSPMKMHNSKAHNHRLPETKPQLQVPLPSGRACTGLLRAEMHWTTPGRPGRPSSRLWQQGERQH